MVNKLTKILIVWILISGTTNAQSQPVIWTIGFENIRGEQKTLYCEVAATDVEKRRGLMFRDKLEADQCMIFVYDKPLILSFWMKNTYLPLSIAFIDERFFIMELFDMKPHDETIISSTTPGLYAIEVNRGWFKKNYVYQGSKIKMTRREEKIIKKKSAPN